MRKLLLLAFIPALLLSSCGEDGKSISLVKTTFEKSISSNQKYENLSIKLWKKETQEYAVYHLKCNVYSINTYTLTADTVYYYSVYERMYRVYEVEPYKIVQAWTVESI